MARVRMHGIVDHLNVLMKNALEDAVRRSLPGQIFNKDDLYKEFAISVRRRFQMWETVPDRLVERLHETSNG